MLTVNCLHIIISSQTVYVKYSVYCSEINIRQPYYRNETILYKAVWSDDDHLYVMWMNRFQNKSHLVHYHIENNAANVKEVSLNYIWYLLGIEIY